MTFIVHIPHGDDNSAIRERHSLFLGFSFSRILSCCQVKTKH
uniref:Uncharacterized protein n=1 Tax=Rhizophora mucronata TaxID=61149 RepID=A0A2P2K812_RHIMU